jgi:hypothetical protein
VRQQVLHGLLEREPSAAGVAESGDHVGACEPWRGKKGGGGKGRGKEGRERGMEGKFG